MFTRITLCLIGVLNLGIALLADITSVQFALSVGISLLIMAEGIHYMKRGE
jgi:hypothetical protein